MLRFLMAVVAIFVVAQAAPSQADPRTGLQIQHVEGTLSGGGGVFKNGTLVIQNITPSGNNSQPLMVAGTISGIAVLNDGAVQHVSNVPFSTRATLTTDAAPNALAAASCSILHLDLGPIDLNVLGLMVTTNEIVINITGIPNGPNGGLLGSLLCSLANLLSTSPIDLTALNTLLTNLNNLLSSILMVLG